MLHEGDVVLSDTSPEVVGLGQCSHDILGQLERYPELDQKAELRTLRVQGGGPVATAMVTLARLGIRGSFIGAVGDDDFGEKIRSGLLEEGVDCMDLVEEQGASSQVAFISVDVQGYRNIFWHRGNATPVIPGNFKDTLSSGVQVLHLDGLHQEVALKAARMARDCGVTTVLDAGTFRSGIERLLPLIDHLVVAEKFACQYADGHETPEALKKLACFGSKAVIVTLGAKGCVALSEDGEYLRLPAFDVRAVDTTGCGDVFHGGYIYGLLNNWGLAETLRFASACAALKAKAVGGRTAIPRLHEVVEFLEESQ